MTDAVPERRAEYRVAEHVVTEIQDTIKTNAGRLESLEIRMGRFETGLADNTNVTKQMLHTVQRIDEHTSGIVKGFTAIQGFTATTEWIVSKATKFGIPLGAAAIWLKHYFWPPK